MTRIEVPLHTTVDLTDEQWDLVQPLLPPLSPFARGRPPAEPRATLNGIFYKLRLAAPWFNLPEFPGDRYPSWQTCYRAYRRWDSAGILQQVYKLLYCHLLRHTGLSLIQVLSSRSAPPGVSPCVFPSRDHPLLASSTSDPESPPALVTLLLDRPRWRLVLSPGLEGTWQGSTALLLTQVILARVWARLKSRTLPTSASE